MDVVGKIIVKLPLMKGTSQAGNPWQKQEYVLETEDSYPKKVHFDFFGEKAEQNPLNIGDRVRLYFDIESREYNGKWYTNIRGWKAEQVDSANPGVQSAPVAAPQAPVTPVPDFAPTSSNESDDLPF